VENERERAREIKTKGRNKMRKDRAGEGRVE